MQKHKFAGKELDRMYGVDWYDFDARQQDPLAGGRFLTIDPLCVMAYNISPYVYCRNNPLKFIDPSGMLESPYFNKYGEFLGTDENGFTGDIFITDYQTFASHSKRGIANAKEIQEDTHTVHLSNTTSLSNAALSSIFTHVLNQTLGEKYMSQLYNGKVSINSGNVTRYSKEGSQEIAKGYNNPAFIRNAAQYTSDYTNNQIRITIDKNAGLKLKTVQAIKNYIGIHEYKGHGILNYRDLSNHWKCYYLQITDPSFKQLSINQQNELTRLYHYYAK